MTLATAKIYQSSQLVAISPVSTSVELSNLTPYLFRTVPSDYIVARALAQYMLKKLDRQNVVIFYSSQSNYSQSLKSEFTAAVSLGGGRVVNTFDLADANFSAADSFSQAIDGEATAIMLAASTDTLDKALQVVRVNRQRLSLLGGDDVMNGRLILTADAGRYWEVDPLTLETITPIEYFDEHIVSIPFSFFPLVANTAHPFYDPNTKELISYQLKSQPRLGSLFVDMLSGVYITRWQRC